MSTEKRNDTDIHQETIESGEDNALDMEKLSETSADDAGKSDTKEKDASGGEDIPVQEVPVETADDELVDSAEAGVAEHPDENETEDEELTGEHEPDESETENEEPTEEDESDESETENEELTEEDESDESETEDGELQDDEENEAAQTKKKSRKRHRGRKRRKKENGKAGWKKALIITGSIVGVLAAVYFGIAAFFYSHFLINTTINGKDFSGKTVADVESYLKEQVAGYELTLIELNNATDKISGSEISLVYKENSDVENALKGQNQLLWITSLFSRSSEDITIEVEYDETALTEKLQTIQAVTVEQTAPVSAHPEFDGESYVVAPEEYGTAVNMENLTAKISQYITNFEPQIDLKAEGCYMLPEFTSESPEVQAACDTMNGYLKASITYPMDKAVVVDKTLIATWLSYDANMQVTFNEEAVREWMREFGSTYDTLGKTRSITSPLGETTEVSGGTYGWSVNEAEETEKLIESIKNGVVEEREPLYHQKAAAHSAQDWGSTYIEVDISAQHMWYIVDGSVALESDVVTGLPNGERDTPTGVYSILYTERDATLKGETDPETGEPSYETPVAFWMPFTHQGHGFHDATWQSSFGGSRYQSNGSHGCVNMPYDKASQLFDMIGAGTPVIVHA